MPKPFAYCTCVPKPSHFFFSVCYCLAVVGSHLAWSQTSLASQSTAPQTSPNIVLFLVDDMGWQDTSVPFADEITPFNLHFKTPNMAELAKHGIRFTDAYAHAVCSPTRTSIMTGQNPARHHVTNWTLHRDTDTSGSWGRVGAPTHWKYNGLQPDDVTLPKLLQQAGYFTIHCGKAHWGANDTAGSDPAQLGFDINIAGHAAGAPGSYQGIENYGNEVPGTRTRPWGVPGLKKHHGTDTHLTDALTLEAIEALRQAVKTGKPFFLYMAHYAVHVPIQPHERFLGNYINRVYSGTQVDIPLPEAKYASMVEGMDDSLGRLLEALEELGVAENTLVIFTSDNGGLSVQARGVTPRNTQANTHNWPLKAGKGSAYEGGTRVPLIVSWAKPSSENALQAALPLPADAISKQPVLSEDLFPTLLQLAGARRFLPADYSIDGKDIVPFLSTKKEDPLRPIVFHYPHVWGPKGPGYEPHSAMRVGDWKVIYFYNSMRWELYNLQDDLGEQDDVAGKQPERLQELAQQLQDELIDKGAQWPVDRKSRRLDPLLTPEQIQRQGLTP